MKDEGGGGLFANCQLPTANCQPQICPESRSIVRNVL